MLFDMDKLDEEMNAGLIHLSKTTLITDELIDKVPIWKELKEMYSKVRSPRREAFVSIINAILTSKRAAFSITRSGVNKLVIDDENISRSKGFANKLYGDVRAYLHKSGFKILYEGEKRRPSLFLVEHPLILDYLKDHINFEDQKAEALAFVQNIKLNKEDVKKDLEGRSENQDVRGKSIDERTMNEEPRAMSVEPREMSNLPVMGSIFPELKGLEGKSIYQVRDSLELLMGRFNHTDIYGLVSELSSDGRFPKEEVALVIKLVTVHLFDTLPLTSALNIFEEGWSNHNE